MCGPVTNVLGCEVRWLRSSCCVVCGPGVRGHVRLGQEREAGMTLPELAFVLFLFQFSLISQFLDFTSVLTGTGLKCHTLSIFFKGL